MTPELAPVSVSTPPATRAGAPVWTPSDEDVRGSNPARFVADLRGRVPALAELDAMRARMGLATAEALAYFRGRPTLRG